MSRPKHQHFIPKSYLRNFAIAKDDKYFVETKLRKDDKPKDKLISIRDICVDKNIYTLHEREEGGKYALEEFYASEIDGVYPEVYGWLTDPKLEKIDGIQRAKIIMVTMSLFFRTPKFLNHNQRTLDRALQYGAMNHQDKNGNVKFKFKHYNFDFNIKDYEQVRTDWKIKNKTLFIQSHLKDWHEFVKLKTACGISVYRIVDDFDLITSDNPVVMHSVIQSPFNVFDPSNIISLPLDNKHYMSIMPNTEAAMIDTIYRADRDKWFVLTTNLQVANNCEEWILGKPDSITNHLSDQIRYGAETEENLLEFENFRQRAKDGKELASLAEIYGFFHENTVNKLAEMLKKEIYQKDPEILKMRDELAAHGIILNI